MILALAATASADFAEVTFDTADGGSVNANLYGDGPHAVLLAHARHIFRTAQAGRLTEIIVNWLAPDDP